MTTTEFKRKRELDEGFWQDLEARLRSSLGQPCCTLSGLSTGLIAMPGNFAVVIHGESECASCFHHTGVSTHKFYCVGLTEDDFTSGETRGKLKECLQLVATETKPDVIFVLGACPVEIIGDQFETPVEEVEKETGVPMKALHTSGLKVGSQAAMLDWMFETLASLPPASPNNMKWVMGAEYFGAERRDREARTRTTPPKKKSLNLIGLPDFRRGNPPEWYQVLSEAGLAVIANAPYGADLDVWRSSTFARKTFVADKRLYPRLFKVLEDSGQEIVEVPLPIGVKQTEEFYRIIAREFAVEKIMEEIIADRRARAQEKLEAFAKRVNGIKMAMGIRMLNNYRADQLAYEGLGDVEALAEMGFDIKLLVQGPPEERMRQKFVETFEELGCTLPFDIFPEPWGIGQRLKDGGFDAAYLADHCRMEAHEANVPMVVSRELMPYFEGVETNLIRMGKTLEEVLDI